MARLTCNRSGWGTVRDPKTGERIPTDAKNLSTEQAERLAERYGPIDVEVEGPLSGMSTEDVADNLELDIEDPTCAGNDGDCSRSVDSPGAYCWQHTED